ncbi:TPA: hypothetical protein DDW35_11120 [Candidatus Sumerlaeota bacterium]|nr:hypothetical protein [Candidatus Sumerlaeota bacterium]
MPGMDCKKWCAFILKKVAKNSPKKMRLALMFQAKLLESGISKPKIDRKIRKQGDFSGVTNTPRKTPLVVSLTTFPARMDDVYYAIYSLLNQTLKPDAVVLWLSTEECPGLERDLPAKLLSLKKRGLTIQFAKNLKQYNKLMHSLTACPEAVVVTADDDVYYESDWLEKLYQSYLAEPAHIHCHRAYQIRFDDAGKILPYAQWKRRIAWSETAPSFLNFITGVGGVLYPPHCLHEEVLREDLFLKFSPFADDIWFWAMAVLKGTKIRVVKNNTATLTYVNLARDMSEDKAGTLFQINRSKNDEQLQAVLDYYNLTSILWKAFQAEYPTGTHTALSHPSAQI